MAMGGAIVAAYIAQTFFNLSNTQIAIACGIVALMALSYQVNTLREGRPQLKKSFVNDLLYSEPITVKHDPPKTLTPDGKQTYGAEKHDFECFMLFWFFGEAVNRELEDSAIRIQEINTTEISGSLGMESPTYGRRYEIFCNQVKIGLLQIVAQHGLLAERDRPVYADITLDRVPITAVSHHQISGFLTTIAGLVTNDGDSTERERAMSAIHGTMAETMWDVLRDYTLGEQPVNQLEVCFSGTPDRYYRIEAHERAARMRARAEQDAARQSA